MRHRLPTHQVFRSLALLGVAVGFGCSSSRAGTTEPGAIVVTILPVSATIVQGGTSIVAVTLTRIGDFTGPVSLTVTDTPVGVTAAISDQQTTGTVTHATVTITVAGAVAVNTYNLVLHATGAGVAEATATFVLVVTQAPPAPCAQAGELCEQWASGAIASSEYRATEWNASQATAQPDVTGCADDFHAWASAESNGVDWLELTFPVAVRPIEIRIHENFGVSSIVKVEVKDDLFNYHTVYTAQAGSAACPRVLTVPVAGVSVAVKVVRISIDQRILNDWNEIDAVKLVGIP
jgi:hypothetical protein